MQKLKGAERRISALITTEQDKMIQYLIAVTDCKTESCVIRKAIVTLAKELDYNGKV